MHDLEGDQLVIGRRTSGDEEEGGVAAVDDFGVCRNEQDVSSVGRLMSESQLCCDVGLCGILVCCLPTFVFQEIAHPRPAGQHELSHILDDLGFILWRKSGEPLCKALESRNVVSKTKLLQASASEAARSQSRRRVGDDEPLCPGGRAESGSWRGSAQVARTGSIQPYWIAIVKIWGGGRLGG